jgi:hypothetical protein
MSLNPSNTASIETSELKVSKDSPYLVYRNGEAIKLFKRYSEVDDYIETIDTSSAHYELEIFGQYLIEDI